MVHARKVKSIAKSHAAAHAASSAEHSGEYGPRISTGPAMQTPVLVLNASYEPINICGARRALVLVLKGVARTEEEQGTILHAARSRMPMPSVIRLLEYRRIPHQTRALSRKNILLRDRNSCQYCGVVLPSCELTLDHVLPRSRGGLSTWENLVACCHSCNRRKGNQLLSELRDIKLLREPRPFSLHTSRHIMRMIGHSDQKWRKYLYY
jgi:5-methylcytosine-specific restriction endonuclease McrA